MAPDRVEIEFFGVEETGKAARKVGALEEAHGGTLYIDEVADMPLETQGKLLRVLVEQKFQRVGGGPKVHVDVRIVSSTSRDLEREMAQRPLPPGPVPPPQRGAAARAGPGGAPRGHSRSSSNISCSRLPPPPACRRAASATTPWPCCNPTTGRATSRQLRNIIERLMIMAGGEADSVITADMLPDDIGSDRAAVAQRRGRRASDVAAVA